jgi:hypothetical protein
VENAYVKTYYDARAPEYDEWYLGLGKFAEFERPGGIAGGRARRRDRAAREPLVRDGQLAGMSPSPDAQLSSDEL